MNVDVLISLLPDISVPSGFLHLMERGRNLPMLYVAATQNITSGNTSYKSKII
jgi:hypothetical protein